MYVVRVFVCACPYDVCMHVIVYMYDSHVLSMSNLRGGGEKDGGATVACVSVFCVP